MRVCLVIPVHNEEKVLERNIAVLQDYLKKNPTGDAFVTVIAENGSTDRTLAIAQELSKRLYPDVRVWHSSTAGRGAALKSVWTETEADVVGYMDADLSTELEALPRALAEIRNGSDLVTGSRLLIGAKVGRSWRREAISRIFNGFRRMLLGGVSDSQCGFKFMRRERILPLLRRVEDNHWFFDTELLTAAGDAGLKVAEIPVAWSENRKSTVKILPAVIEEGNGILRLWRRPPL